jgi:hypothetical protein
METSRTDPADVIGGAFRQTADTWFFELGGQLVARAVSEKAIE